MYKGLLFLIFLFLLLILLFVLKGLTQKYLKNDKKYNRKFINRLSYSYIMFYSIVAGLLIYFGLEDFKEFLAVYIDDISLCGLISVTIVITFCFIYSALFKDTVEIIFNDRIKIEEWKNVEAYVIGRMIVIFFIYIVYNKVIKHIKRK